MTLPHWCDGGEQGGRPFGCLAAERVRGFSEEGITLQEIVYEPGSDVQPFDVTGY